MKVLSVTVTSNTKNYKPAFGDKPCPDENSERLQRNEDEFWEAEKRKKAGKEAREKRLHRKAKRKSNIKSAQKELRASVQESMRRLTNCLCDNPKNISALKQFFGSLPDSGRASKLKITYLKRVLIGTLKKRHK